MQLLDYVGHEIIALVPVIDPVNLQRLALHSVETGGIWVESQTQVERMLSSLRKASSPRKPVFFLPYAAISYAFVAVEGTALSESAFGL